MSVAIPGPSVARPLGVVLGVLLAVAPAGCELVEPPPPSASPSPAASGVRGRVLVGRPCARGDLADCYEPYAADLVVLDADGHVIGSAASDPGGTFEVLLPPGSYTIAPRPGGDPFPVAPLQAVSVVEGAFTEVEIRYDSGTGVSP